MDSKSFSEAVITVPIEPKQILSSSRYFIEGEEAAARGKALSDCRYFEGSIAADEWRAGYTNGTLDLYGFSTALGVG